MSDYHPWATYIYAREEARARGDRRVGTDHLLLGLLQEPGLAGALGCDLGAARAALAAMDRAALTSVGLDAGLDAPPIPTREARVEPGRPRVKAVLADRLPLTPAAKTALRSTRQDLRRGEPIDPALVLAAVLELSPPDPAAALLDELGVDRDAVRARLAASGHALAR